LDPERSSSSPPWSTLLVVWVQSSLHSGSCVLAVASSGPDASVAPTAESGVEVGVVDVVVDEDVVDVDEDEDVEDEESSVDAVVDEDDRSVWISALGGPSGSGKSRPTESPADATADWTGSGSPPAAPTPPKAASAATPPVTSLAARVSKIMGRFHRVAAGTVSGIDPSPATNRASSWFMGGAGRSANARRSSRKASVAPPLVDEAVVGDREQPGAEAGDVAGETAEALERPEEHVAREVVGVGGAVGPEVAGERSGEPFVEGREGGGLVPAGPVEPGREPLGRPDGRVPGHRSQYRRAPPPS
jgi:hypothetical protein